MAKVSMYPTSVTQPNQNTSNGTAGKYTKEIKRNGKIGVKKLNNRDLNDPKYYHLWKNTSNLKEGKVANCGNKSSYHCSHKTYYNIKGYRNTCPIAGATGTYTQPAGLHFKFNPSAKGIASTATIKSVKVTFKHRCVGVDVATDDIYTSWGPNFSGFKHYPNRKVITATFAGQTATWDTNPPLSTSKYDTVTLTFKSTSKNKITYNHLAKGELVIQYGNNLSTNPGNIYIDNFNIEVEYEPGKIYIEGSQNSDTLYTTPESSCASKITFTIEAGYKNGNSKVSPAKAPKKFQNNTLTITTPYGVSANQWRPNNDGKTIMFEIEDLSNIEGEKDIYCSLAGVGEYKFNYKAIKRPRPTITIPSKIEKNTAPKGIVSITARDGCAPYIIAYDGDLNHQIYSFNNLNVNNNSNMIPQNDIDNFYKTLSKLSCGDHKIIFKRGNEPINEMPISLIKIVPTEYTLKFYEIREDESRVEILEKVEVDQNKYQNSKILIEFIKTKDLLENPVFSIINPTYGLNNTPVRVNNTPISFIPNKEGGSMEFTLGTYFPGDYIIKVEEPENCSLHQTNLLAKINPKHKQHFDEIFVRGEDSTAFDYDYLVALEGDTIKEPLYVEGITLGASYKDIKICTSPIVNTTINNPKTIPVTITNTSTNDIDNLFIELNALFENEDGDLEVSTDEWINEDGIFYNFTEKFKEYNRDLSNIIDIKNLSIDEDDIDEEDVYIHVKKMYPKQSLEITIPIFSYIEKTVYLQMLLFDEVIGLYDKENCISEQQRFEKISINVFDAILTDMKIIGDTDILTPKIINCPLECFKTEGITYYIKNIDSSNAETSDTLIINDPRLIPYKIEKDEKTIYKINEEGNGVYLKVNENGEEIFTEEPISQIKYESGIEEKEINLIGTKVINTIDFNDETYENSFIAPEDKEKYNNQIKYPLQTLKGYTDAYGYVTLYITIPKTKNKNYTVKDITEISDIKIDVPNSYYKIIDDLTVYKPGETLPLKIKVYSIDKKFTNQIHFYPNIYTPGSYDHITVYYKICNLKNNEGILQTIFKTDPNNYKLLENEVSEDILCGVPTSLNVSAQLTKVIVEQTQYNRLYINIKNKNRFNKDIKIYIDEKEDVLKYSYFDHDIEKGNLEFKDKQIVWNIDYLEKDSVTKGYIDFRGDILGLSQIEIYEEDFATDIEFNQEYCECPRTNNSGE